MTTARSVILSSVPNTLTSVYTNSSGAPAALKSVNINGLADVTNLNGAAGGDEWNYFGSNINMYAPIPSAPSPSAYGAGIPYVINLSADRLLYIWLPHYMHNTAQMDFPVSGANVLHTQIVEYTGSKYRAGPIVNVNLAAFAGTIYNAFQPTLTQSPNGSTATYGASHFKAIALTSTKVVCSIRYSTTFVIFRLTINGNVVEVSSTESLAITSTFGTTAHDYGLATVIDDTNQVVVMAGDASTWKMRAFSIPDTGALSALGAAVFDTTIGQGGYHGAITPLNRALNGGLNYYSVFGSTASTSGTIRHVSYASSTNTFALVGTAATVSSAGSAWYGVQGACMSTDSSINGVFFTTDPSASTNYRYYRQTSIAGATSTLSTATASRNAASTREIRIAYNWGNERAVFVGANFLVAIDSAGTATELLPATDTTNTSAYVNYWFNFQSRPIYTFYDPGTVKVDRVTQYYSRTGMTSSTNLGVRTDFGNYLPWGYEYGHHYDWSDVAGCWFVGQYGKIYAISVDGDILDEVGINTFFPDIAAASLYSYDVRNLVVLPSGRILVALAHRALTDVSYTYHSNTWNSIAGTGYAATLAPVTNPRELNKTYPLNYITLTSLGTTSHLTWHVDLNGEERAYLLWHDGAAAPVTQLTQYYGGGWQSTTATTVGSTTAGAWNAGLLSNFRLIQDTPSSPPYPRGLWRIVGGSGTNTQAAMRQLYISTSRWDPLVSASSFRTDTGTAIHTNSSTVGRYGMYSRRSRNISVSVLHDVANNINRVWASVDGKMPSLYGWFSSANTANTRYATSAVTSGGYIVAYNNTSGNSFPTAPAYVFNGANTANSVVSFSTPANSGVYTVKQTSTTSMQIFNANSIGNTYAVTTPTDTARFALALTSGSNTFFIANQMVSTSNATNIRTNDTYLVPNGASISVMSDKPSALTAMLSIVEEV